MNYIKRAMTEPLGFGLLPSIADNEPMPSLREIDAACKVVEQRLPRL